MKYINKCLLVSLCFLCSLAVNGEEQFTLYYTDVLGSPVAATDLSGKLLWTEDYEPFGKQRLKEQYQNHRGYTGHVKDANTDLVYMQARYYDPLVGRFYGVDPVGFVESNAQSFNRYLYVNNNPYKYKDPNGEYLETAWDIANVAMGVHSFTKNAAAGNWGGAAVDALGVVADVAAVLTPLPGGAGSVIHSTRLGNKVADATKGAEKGGLNLFKRDENSTTKASGWKDGDFMLHLTNKGSPKANWKQNSGFLREQMSKNKPIFDSFRDPKTGQQIQTDGFFLNAERKLLESRGWKYNSSSGAYHPPGSQKGAM